MKQTIDSYRFASMEEPSDEILLQLMKEAAEEAMARKMETTRLYFEHLAQEAKRRSV